MKTYKLIFVIGLLPFLINVSLAQDNSESEIKTAISTGNVDKLSGMFNSAIDLELDDQDGNFSKKQAEMIIRDFFKNNPAKTFTINHKGSSNDGSRYMIGTFTSTNGSSFRVNILLKETDQKMKIHQLQFEKD